MIPGLSLGVDKSIQLLAWGGAVVGLAAFAFLYVEGERDQREARVRGQIAETTAEAAEQIREQTDEEFRSTGVDDVRERLRTGQFAVGGLPRFGPEPAGMDSGGSGDVRRGLGSPDDGSRDRSPGTGDPVSSGDGVRRPAAGEPQRADSPVFGGLTCTQLRARLEGDLTAYQAWCEK